MAETVGRHLYVSGRVQGVGFRHFIVTRAVKLDLQGWVRNLSDGRVELVVVGEKQRVETLLGLARKGPSWAMVERIEINDLDDIQLNKTQARGFKVRY